MLEKVYTKTAPDAIGPYSQAVICNNMVYTSGQIAINPENGQINGEDIITQTNQVMKNLEQILLAAKTNFNNVIKTTCFLKNMSDFSKFNEVYAKYMISKPARSCVAVKELPKDVLVEVEVIALIK